MGAKAHSRLQAAGTKTAAEAAESLRQSKVWGAVLERMTQYEKFDRSLEPSGFKLIWDNQCGQLWLHAPPGATWFEYKLVCDVEAPLTHCLAYSQEVELVPKFEPQIVGVPLLLGFVQPLLLTVRLLFAILVFRVELIFQVFRFCNMDYGFIAERIP